MNFDDVQQQEIEALKAIYGTDFVENVTKENVWKTVDTNITFALHLRPTEEELKSHVSLILQVRFLKKYPSVPPELTLIKEKGVSDAQLDMLQQELIVKAKTLQGQESIFTLASFVEESLCKANSAIRGVKHLSSHQLYSTQKLELEQKQQQELEKKLSELKEEQRLAKIEFNLDLAARIEKEIIDKQKVLLDKANQDISFTSSGIQSPVDNGMSSSSIVNKQQVTDIEAKEPAEKEIWKVSSSKMNFNDIIKFPISNVEGFYKIYTANYKGSDMLARALSITHKKNYIDNPSNFQKLKDMYKVFDSISKLKHKNIVSLFACKLSIIPNGFQLLILEDYYETLTLFHILKKSGTVNPKLSKEYMKGLLKGLAYLHSNNIIHRDVKCSNIVFDKENNIKLLNSSFNERLESLNSSIPFTNNPHKATTTIYSIPNQWKSPESLRPNFIHSKKDDLWNLGIVFVQMLCGVDSATAIGIEDFLGGNDIVPSEFINLITGEICVENPNLRSTPYELLKHPFFNAQLQQPIPNVKAVTDTKPSYKHALKLIESNSHMNEGDSFSHSSNEVVAKKIAVESSIVFPPRQTTEKSRYEADFDEIEFLGKGGFGSVVKSLNKIDSNFYAIKKVPLRPRDKEKQKLLREVMALSRLHHEYVVRYFTAWVENVGPSASEDELDGLSFDDESSSFDEDEEDDDDDEDDWLSSSRRTSFVAFEPPKLPKENGFDGGGGGNLKRLKKQEENEGLRMLYIQMEYCEKKSLREVIDEGFIDEEQSWKFFRQIVEGLAYVHSQGMIHRDLKPSNIFLDSNGNVKLGDFGLATVKNEVAPFKNYSSDSLIDDVSLTNDIGTPIYMAPETLKAGKYNTKVDMFSLGIVFFEMLYPFSTAMQRAFVLRDLRKFIFPSDFGDDGIGAGKKYVNQVHIIKLLLCVNPKDRPSCTELLQSKYLPPKYEEEELAEAFRTIVNPQNVSYYSRLVNALFCQSIDSHCGDFSYEYNSGVENSNLYQHLIGTRVKSTIVKILENHGSISFSAPLLIPKSAGMFKCVEFLDSSGNIIQLPSDLTFPFVRHISRVTPVPTTLKRYTIGRVFRANLAGGQPRSIFECDYDILSRADHSYMPDAEIIFTALQIIDQFPTTMGRVVDYDITINHVNILESVLDFAKIFDPALRIKITSSLESSRSLITPLNATTFQKLGLDKHTCDLIISMDIKGDFEIVQQRLLNIFNNDAKVSKGISTLRTILDNLKLLKIRNRVIFSPLFAYHPEYYQGSHMFQIGKRNNQKYDVFFAGGRYDELINKMKNPFTSTSKLTGVGFNLAIQKITNNVMKEESKILKSVLFHGKEPSPPSSLLSKKADVLIASVGNFPSAIASRIEIASELWSCGISCDYIIEENESSTSTVFKNALSEGYAICAMLKHKAASIKVKNLNAKSEVEVSRTTLIEHIKAELETHSPGPQNTKLTSSQNLSQSITDVSILLPKTSKYSKNNKQKLLVQERGVVSIGESIKELVGLPGIAVELQYNTLAALVRKGVDGSEEVWKSEGNSASQKEYILNIRQHLIKRRSEGEKSVWIFSILDNQSVLFTF